MTAEISEFDAKKQELNCGINVYPILKYLEDLYGKDKLGEIIEPLGLPLSFLKNRKNWVSFDYYQILLKKIVELTGNPKAPFYVAFSVQPTSIYEELYYMAYIALYSESPKQGYKIAFNKNFYQRFSKISDFEIIAETKNSITVKLTYKKGYKQTKINCEACRGFISAVTIAWGLPPAKVEHKICAADGAESCIYIVEWQQKKSFRIVSYLIFILVTSFEAVLYNLGFLEFKDIVITVILFLFGLLLNRYLKFFQKKKDEEIFNFKKNMSVQEALEKIEGDYEEINKIKQELENRNTFLSIINEISDKITVIEDFNLLLIEISDVLVKRLNFTKGVYFQINKTGEVYSPNFEINNSGITNISHTESYVDMKISHNDYSRILSHKRFESIGDFKHKISVSSYFMGGWLTKNDNDAIHFIPVETFDNFAGIFCFISGAKEVIPSALLDDLFKNVSNQLQIGYERIASKSIIENILSSIPAYVLIFDIEEMGIKYLNSIFINSFPFINSDIRNPEVLTGKNIFSVIPFTEGDREKILECLKIISMIRKTENFQVSFENKIFEYSIFSINEINKKIQYAGIILTDITETKNFEQKIVINEKLLALGRVASGIAHEINNPLYVVLANAEEIAEDKNIGSDARKYAEEIIEYTINISNIIKDLSSYSKSLRNEMIVEIDINNIIEESLKLVKYSSNFINVEIIRNFSSIPKIRAAKGEIEQVFINLLNNSLHAMNGNGVIEIITKMENGYISASVKDSGCGILEKNIPYIFDLFYTTKKEDEGTGQGLHIVKKILTKYKAKIEVESELNSGTIFTVYFPVENA